MQKFFLNVLPVLCVSAFLLMGGCNSSHQGNETASIIANTTAHFVPDARVDRLEVQVKTTDEGLILKGETTLPGAKTALFDSLQSPDIEVIDSVQVNTAKNFDKLEIGDLLFFGRPATGDQPRRVVHVGMWIGDSQFIHSSGRVRISSVDSTAEKYDPFNVGRYLEARRYLDNRKGNIKETARMYSNLN